MSLTEKLALVTGASRGIGQAILMELAAPHMTLIGTATTQKGADAITQYLQSHNLKGQGYVLDVGSLESIENLMAELKEKFTLPNILINNAGVTADNLCLRMKEAEWTKVIDTNLTGVFRLSQACMKAMVRARWGRIINISSVVGVIGNPGQANYCAAKAGVLGFTKSLARELGGRGITVNAVAPGFIETDMTRVLMDEQQNKLKEHIPIGRMGHAKEIAYAVEFLASERANYITGETLHVNGGMFMS